MAQGHTDLAQTLWKAAYEEHGPAILAFLVNRTGSRADAEDLLQETFVRAIRAENALRDESKLKSYLFSIAHNQMVNWFRKRRPEAMPETDDTVALTLDQMADMDRVAPDDEASYSDLHGHVFAIMEKMNERYSLAFRYGILEGKTYNEIARQTGWTLSQVKINIYRARRQMIDALGERGFFEPEMGMD